jgi:fibronectin type 3 domain-containing protein
VIDGATYFYVVTAVSAGETESQFSDQVSVTIPAS